MCGASKHRDTQPNPEVCQAAGKRVRQQAPGLHGLGGTQRALAVADTHAHCWPWHPGPGPPPEAQALQAALAPRLGQQAHLPGRHLSHLHVHVQR